MSPKENLLAVLRHQKPERIPWVPLIDHANTPCFIPDELRRDWDMLKVSMYLHEELGCDLLIGAGIVRQKRRNAEYSRRVEGDYITDEYIIAGRTLKTITRQVEAENGQVSHAITEYLIKDENDLETFEMLLDDSYLEYDTTEFVRLSEGIGDKGIVTAMAPRTPLMELIIDRMGIEAFTYIFCDFPDLVERVVKKMHSINIEMYSMIADSEINFDVVRMHEDQDILLTSPETYRKYIMPLMKEYCDICHIAGKIFMMHACGNIKAFLPMILETGIDAHHYLTNRPVGDTSPAEAKGLWKDKITIMATVDPLIQTQGTANDVRENLMEILNEMKPGDNFMIMSPLKPDIPEENIRMIQEIMQKYGRYPMEC